MANLLLPPLSVEARRSGEFARSALRCLHEKEALEIFGALDDRPFSERAHGCSPQFMGMRLDALGVLSNVGIAVEIQW
jgi:hypothetical protein